MSSSNDPPARLPPSMGPGGRPMRPGESPGSLLKEISDIRSHYNVHVDSSAINVSYELNKQQRYYKLPFDNIPLQGMMRTWLWSSPRTALTSGILLIDLIRATENVSGRQITQQEAESFAFHSSKRMAYLVGGQFLGIGAGYYLAWRGRADMKFPFMKPKPAERYLKFPNRYIPILQGQTARLMWQITRANVYAALGVLLVAPFARSMADSSMTVGLYRDPRTNDLMKTMKGSMDRLHSNRAQAGVPRIEQPQEQNETAMYGANLETADDSYQQPYSSQYNQQNYPSDTTFTDDSTDTGVMDDQTIQQSQAKQPPPNAWGKAQNRTTNTQSQSSSDFFFDDDASPTARNDPDMTTPKPYNRQSSGSAWDRIRGGRPAQTQKSSQQQSSSSSSGGDRRKSSVQDADAVGGNFSFSKDSEERQLAKEQAQKDFDAMLERERQEGGSAEYVRDMQATGSGTESGSSTGNAWERRRRG